MYRYRATNALFPFCPPYRYPYARIIRRFFIGAITVAILAFVLILLLLTSTFGMLEMKAVWYVFLSALVCAAPVLLCGLVLAWLRRYRNLRSVLLVALAGTLFWCGIVLYYEHARFQLFDFYRLPSKLSFLRNLFIPALTPTPLPPGEGLFRIQALASVSCKIVVWKDVLCLAVFCRRLCRDCVHRPAEFTDNSPSLQAAIGRAPDTGCPNTSEPHYGKNHAKTCHHRRHHRCPVACAATV